MDFTNTTAIADGNWHHVALVFEQSNGGPVNLYIDGVSDTSTGNGNDWSWPAGQELELGHSHDAFWQSFNGQMDDVRVYNRELSVADVLAIKNGLTPANKSGNVLRLNFDTAPVARVTLTWSCPGAILQSADPVGGPYTDMTYAVSPFYSTLRTGTKFYR